VTVKAYPNRQGDPHYMDKLKARNAKTIAKLSTSLKAVRNDQKKRLKRQIDGPALDLDAAISATADARRAEMPDQRIFQDQGPRPRNLAVHILLDASRSTADLLPGSDQTVLDIEREATGILAQAMELAGDRFAVTAFNSDGRNNVRVFHLKNFFESLGAEFGSALTGLTSAYSTRVGAALRHSGAQLSRQSAHQKLVLLLTDGEPSDIDCADPEYLIEDVRSAVHDLSGQGVHVFCVSLGAGHAQAQMRAFGSKGFAQVTNLSALPEVLPLLYASLTR